MNGSPSPRSTLTPESSPEEVRAAWAAALRSGRYPQTHGTRKVLTKVVPVRHVPADEPVTGEEEATSDGQDPLLSGEAAETHSKPDSEEKVIGPEHALLADDQPRRVWIDRLERDEALARRDAVQALMKEWERSAAPPHEQRPPAC